MSANAPAGSGFVPFSGFSIATKNPAASSTPGFAFGGPTAATPFGVSADTSNKPPAPAPAAGVLGGLGTASTTSNLSDVLAAPKSHAPAAASLAFGGFAALAKPSTPGFAFGGPTAAAPFGVSADTSNKPPAPAPAAGVSGGLGTASTTSNLSDVLAAPKSHAPAAAPLAFGGFAALAKPSTPGFAFGGPTAAAPFGVSADTSNKPSAPAPAAGVLGGLGTASTTSNLSDVLAAPKSHAPAAAPLAFAGFATVAATTKPQADKATTAASAPVTTTGFGGSGTAGGSASIPGGFFGSASVSNKAQTDKADVAAPEPASVPAPAKGVSLSGAPAPAQGANGFSGFGFSTSKTPAAAAAPIEGLGAASINTPAPASASGPLNAPRITEVATELHQQLQVHLTDYIESAKRVAQWEAQLQENKKCGAAMRAAVAELEQQNARMQRRAEEVTQRQADIDLELQRLEIEVATALASVKPQLVTHHDDEREAHFLMTERVDKRLAEIEEKLKHVMGDLFGAAIGPAGAGTHANGGTTTPLKTPSAAASAASAGKAAAGEGGAGLGTGPPAAAPSSVLQLCELQRSLAQLEGDTRAVQQQLFDLRSLA